MSSFSTSLPSVFHVGRSIFDIHQASRILFILVSGILFLTSHPLPAQPDPYQTVLVPTGFSGAWLGNGIVATHVANVETDISLALTL